MDFTVSVSDSLTLNARGDQNYTLDTAITDLELPVATGGTMPLTYTLTSVPGLNFNANTRTLSGTPSTADTTELTYIATDDNGSTAMDTFTVIVAARVAVTAPNDQTYTMNTAITDLTLPEATGGTGTVTYTLAPLPDGLTFTATTRVLSGTPTAMEAVTATYIAMDTNGASQSTTFTITVADEVEVTAPNDQTYTMNTTITDLTLDPATGGTGTVTYTLAPLPDGLTFTATTRVLSGTPTTADTTELTYTATDDNDSTAMETFTVIVAAGVAVTAPVDQTYTMDAAITDLTLDPATGGTGTLTYTLTGPGGLPGGLDFNASTRTLSGTPSTAGTFDLTYEVSDANGANTSVDFTVIVSDSLTLNARGDQNYTLDTAITDLTLPEATGGTGTLTYTLTSVPGLNFNANTRTLSGTPSTADTTELTYIATDDNGSTAMDTFTVIVAARVAVTAPNDQTYTMNTAITDLTLPEATGGTGTVTYTLAPLPDGLTFTATTRVLSGTPTAMEAVTATYIAMDTNGASQSTTFTITVADEVAVTAPNDQTYTMNTTITDLTLDPATGGTGTLTYTLTGPGGLPGGLDFNAGTRTLSGTPNTAGTTTLTYMVTDTNNASTSVDFTVIVNDGLALSARGDQDYTQDKAITDLQLPAATGGTAPLIYTLTSVPGLTFTPGSRILSGTPNTAATTTLTYEVMDGNGASTSVDFMVTVNAGLALTASGDQDYTQGRAITDLQLPEATGGTGTLTYTLTSVPGLNFNANNRTLSGTPTTAATTELTYTATDDNGSTAMDTFTVIVAAGVAVTAPNDQTYTMDTAITDLTLDPATGGTGTVTYTLAPLPNGLTFTATTRVLSGTPTTADTTELTYIATDDNGSTAMETFTVIVAAGVAVTAPVNQTYTMDTAITDLTLPEATGGTGTLTYTLTSVPGLNFNANTRILSGTPSTAGTFDLTYMVTDTNGASTSVDFTVIVSDGLALTASGNQNYTLDTAIDDLQLPAATGGTAPLQYTLTGPGDSALPAGLTFDTRTLSGTPSTAGTTLLTYMVTDANNASTTATFMVIVNAGLALTASGDQNYTQGRAITDLELPEATGGTGTLTYTLTGPSDSVLPRGLEFDTRTLSGTPSTAGTTLLTYTVTDTNNASKSATFTVSVSEGLALSARGDQDYTQDTAITDLQLPAATGGTGTLTYTLTNVPGLTFTPGTRTLSGTPGTAGTTLLTYEVSDANNASTSVDFTVIVNASLTLTASGDQNYTQGTAINNLELPVATGGTAPLTYTLTSVPGLDFDPGTRILSGTPSMVATTTLTYEVMDGNGASTSVDFMVIVNAGLALTAPANQNYTLDTAITGLTLPEATGGTAPLIYTLTSVPGLTFTPGSRILSGTPDTAATTTLTYEVTDTNGASTSVDFTVIVSDGLVLTASGNQNYTQGTAINNLELPVATGGTGTLTYTLTSVPGLNFNANTRTLSGTPSTAGTTTLTYEVTDANGASTSVNFMVIVNAGLALTAPANQNYTLDTAITGLTLPEASGGTAPLTYTLTGPGDGNLPGGLTFGSRILSGTPDTAATTTLTYEVTDANGASTTATFMVIVSDGLALSARGDQNYTQGRAITDLELPVATGGTAPLTYTLTSVPGLSFTPGTRTLSGTPNTAATTELTYIATDDNGSTAMDTFTVIVAARVAVTAPNDQTYTMNTAITDLTLPEATGGTGTVTYTLAPLPDGLTFTATTRVLSGTPTAMEAVTATYIAMDTNGASQSTTFTITVADEVEVTAPNDQTYTMNTTITDLTLDPATGGTGTVTYTLAPLPDGLTFTATTRVLSGTPTTADTTELTYTATDDNDSTAMETFTVIVAAGVAVTAPVDQTYTMDAAITDLTLDPATGGTGTLTYTLTGPGGLPGGLDFNASTRTLSGTPNTAGTFDLTYEVSDANGANTSVDFTVIVSDSLTLNARGDQNYTLDTAITDLTLPAATGGTGTLTYTLTSVPGLTFNASTRTLSGTPSTAGNFTLTYTVTDTNNASKSATFTVSVSEGLALSASGNQNYTLDTAIDDLELPAATGGTGTLTYTLTNVPGLNFNANNRTLSGTPSTPDTFDLTYEVTDTNNASTTATFMVIVNAGLALTASGNQNYTQGRAITDLELPVATGGTAPLQYTLTGPGDSALPAGLTFDTRTLSGTPSTAATTTLTYIATDDNGSTAMDTFTITVADEVEVTAPNDQTYTMDTAIMDLTLPEATGGTGTLTYTLTGPGDSALPGGLTFNASTRTLSGTPDTAGTTILTYEVTDTNNASKSATFTIIVSEGLALSARGDQNYTEGRAITDLQLPEATGGTGTLTYTLTSVPGLNFNANNRTLSGTPDTAATTTLTYEVTDTNGANTNATFTVIVSDGLALTASGDQNYTLDTEIPDLQLPAATGGTAPLIYTLTGPGDSALPGGLAFGTRTLSGTPDMAATTTLTYAVSDANGASTSVDFTVTVNASLALNTPANQNYTQGTAITDLQLPEATGGTGTLTYTLTSVPGLNFTPGTRTLSGTPGTAGTTLLTYEVSDANNASTSVDFTVIVNASLTLTASGDQNYTQGTAINNLELPVATGGTGTLTYTLTSVPGLNFNANNRTLSGTPSAAATTELTYTATDDNGSTAMDTFTVIVAAGVAVTAPNDQTYTMNTAITGLTLPEATGGTGTLTYTLTGLGGLPGGLDFNAGTRILSGTPSTAGTTTLTYMVTDTNNASTSVDFTVIVNAGLALSARGNQNYTLDTEITGLELPVATGGTGTLTYTLTSVPGLTFTPGTRTLSGTPSTAGNFTLTYTVTDTNNASKSATFTVSVSEGLALSASGNQNYTLDTAIDDLELPAATGGTGTLTYTLTNVPGLNFNANNRTLSGTPSTPDTFTLTYEVTDTNNASTTATFMVIVNDGLALSASGDQNYTQGRAITDLQLPEATGGTGTLTYTLTSVPGLNFNANNRTLSGTPNTAGTTILTYTVTDTNGASTNATFMVIVNDGLALTAPANQNYTLDTAITGLELPAATGGTGTLTYTLTSVPGLNFNANNRTLSGTPSMASTTTLTYEVTDTNGASTNATFMVIVNDGLALSASGNQNYTLDTAIDDLQLPAATGGTGTLTYTLTNVPGLNFNANNRTLSGTPSTADTTELTYIATDDNGSTAMDTFTVIVAAGVAVTAPNDQTYTMNTAITGLALPEATGGTGTVTYTLAPLPNGLTFTATTRVLSGTPTTADTTELTYTATDDNGSTAMDTFTVTVADEVEVTAPNDQTYTMNTTITDLSLPMATGGTGTVTYTLAPLPNGLIFNATTRVLSGTPTTTDTTELTYTATDDNGSTAMDTFTVIVAAGVAVTAPGDQTYTMGTAITALTLTPATGGTTPVTYTLAPLPNGLIFNATTRVLSGTPTTTDTTELTYTATDDNGSTAMDTFTVTVADEVEVTAPGDQTYTMDTAITALTLTPATGGTTPVTYTLAPLPNGLIFNATTRVLSGTPTTTDTTELTYTATDDNGSTAMDTFTVTVADEVEVTAPGDQTYTMDTAITDLALAPTTGGTTPVTYTLTPLPNGLIFNETTRVLSGTPTAMETVTATYTATDDNGSTAMDTFTVIVAAGVAVTAPGDQTYTMDTAITALSLPMATGGTTPVTYTLAPLPNGLIFNADTRVLSGTPNTTATTELTYMVTDTNGASTNATFMVIVSDGLALSARGNQNYTLDTEITGLELPVATGGTAPLTYTLTSVPGLAFDAGARTLSGTPSTAATTTLTYMVTDTNGANTNATFMVIVSDGLALSARGNQNYTLDTEITGLELPVATGGTGTLTYTLTSVPGLNFNAGTRTLSGTPSTAGTTTLTYEVTDTNGASTTATFMVTVNASLTLTASGNQNYTLDTAITDLELPAATGGTAPLTYTLTRPGGLPGGLDFDPGTRTLSGTPDMAATTTLTYAVTDDNGASTTATFTVIVSDGLALSARGNQNYTRGTLIPALELPVAAGGTAPLTYTLTSVPGLDFDPGTRILSGTPNTPATTTLTYEVMDGNGASTSATFMVIVNDGLALTASGDQNYTLDTAITDLELPVATGGTVPLTYTLTGPGDSALPGGLTFGTRTLSGTPNTTATTTLTYRVTDTNGASTTATFTVTVNASLTLSARGNQNYTLDTAITALELPVATGGTGTLTYTLTSVPGLTFTPGSRILSGTPDTAATTTLTYEVTDTNGASTTATFMVIVSDGLALSARGNQNYTLDTPITDLPLPAATGGTGTLTYTLTSVPGLEFDADTRTLSGTPDTAGTTNLTYTVTDDNGASTTATFTVIVSDGLALTAPGDQNYTLDTAITGLELPIATGGTVPLTYTLTGPGDSALPGGLTFGTRTLSGTPDTAGTTNLTYTVTDDNGASTTATFTVIVSDGLALTAPGDQNYTLDTAITGLELPIATGGTVPLTYTLTGPGDSALPGGLTFGTRTLSGTPNTPATTTLTYEVMDGNGASTSVDFMVIVSDGLALTASGNQNYTLDTPITGLTLPEASGGTAPLIYTLTSVPGLTFTPGSRILSGTPSTPATTTLTYEVSDANNASTSTTFTVIVSDGLALNTPANQNYTRGRAITGLTLPEATGGTGTLTYTLTSVPGLDFDPGTRILSGTPTTAATTTLTYEVMDANNASTTATFTVIVSDGLALNTPANQNYTRGRAITGLTLPEATGGTGTLTYTLTSVSGLTFNANNRTLSGTPDMAGTTTLTYMVTDANGASTSTTFTVIVSDGLALNTPANQNYTLDTPITDLPLPAATGGTGTLTYTLTSVPGLDFNAGTRTLSGTPDMAATTTLTYMVTDANGANTSATFMVIVSDGLALTASGNQNYTLDTAITDLSLPMATGGTGTLTYTLTSVPGLNFAPDTRTLSGTPDMAATTTLTYEVTDANGANTSATFMVIVSDGLALTASGNQNYTLDTAITALSLPMATGGTGTLTYTLTSVPGLNFAPDTRTLSGTPDMAGTTTLTYEVTDANGANTSATFTVIVNASLALTASGNQNYTLDTAITALSLPMATGGTGTLTYTLTSVPGLTFTPGTRILSGTPTTAATTTLTYEVSDANGASTSVDFTVIVSDGLALTASANQNYTRGRAITGLTLPEATGGTGTLTYTLTSVPGLNFNANNRTLSGTPNTTATTTLTYRVSDANGASTTATFTVIVSDGLALNTPANQNYTRGRAITGLTLPEATGGTGTLTYTLTSVPGLDFDPGTRILSGTPTTAATTTLTYMVTDANGANTSATFMVIVSDGLALTASGNQNYTQGRAITALQLPIATGGTGTLTYTLTSVPGLNFNAGTRTLSGTPNTAGTTVLTYEVSDANGASTTATFMVIVNAGLALTASGNQNYTLDTAITDLTLPEATGGTGTLTYTLTSVPGLDFDAGTRTLSGTPDMAGTTTLTYMVTDANGANTSATFMVIVSDGLALTASGNQNYTQGRAITALQLPIATGGTGTLTYTLTSVPGLNFTPGSRILSGTPSTAGTTVLTYEVSDANNASKSATFTVSVSEGLALTASGDQNYTQDKAIPDLELPAATGGTGTLTYTLTSVPGLNFNANNRTLSGTPTTADTTELTYTATDDNGSTAMDTFTVIVAARVAVTAPNDQTYTMDTAITDLTLDPATGGTGTVTYTLAPLPDGLTFTAGTRVLSGTPSTADTTELTYTATDDNGSTAMETFTVIVAAGVAVTAPVNQTYTMDTAITDLTLPEATGGTVPLTYTLTSVPGLDFNANNRTLSGTPSTAGTTVLTYEVSDANNASKSATFTVSVSEGLALTASANQNYTQDKAIPDLELPAATGGTGTLTYTLTNVPGLSFNANNRTLSGTPSTADTTELTYIATDDNGSTAMDTFTITVADEVEVTAPNDQTYTMDTAIMDLTLPEATGGTAPLTYTLTGPGDSALPGGLDFNASTRTLSGTPSTAATTTLTYEVMDGNGASTSVDFMVIVNDGLALTASGNQNYTQGRAIPDLQLPAATGGTGTLTYTLTSVPGLTFTAGTRTLSGTPSTAATTTLTYEVTDDNGASTSVDFTVIVSDGLAVTAPVDQTYTMNTAITGLALPEATGGTEPLVYTLTGPGDSALPGGLNFNANNRTLSGTPGTAGTTTLTYEVMDANGASTNATFTIIVSEGLALSARGDQNYTQGRAITDLELPAATGGTAPLTYTLTNVPGLTFDTRTLSGTPDTAGTTILTYTVTDANNASTNATFTVSVSEGLALSARGDQNYTQGRAITDLELPAATGGTAPLTYTLTNVPGLTFTPGSRTLSGTPGTAGTTVLTYEVSDANNASTSVDFTVIVNASLTLTASGNQNYTQGRAITDLQLPEATGGTGTLTYTLTGPGDSALPAGLDFDTRILSGTPSMASTTTLTYRVSDTNGASTNTTFTVIVNDGLALTARGNQNYTLDTEITALTLPVATGGTGTLTYTLTGPGDSALPGGLTFNAGTRTLSGTPSTAGTTNLTYAVSDANNASQSATFTITVDNEDAPPVFVETTFSQVENTTPTFTLTATEADGDDVTFTLQSGGNTTYFTLTDGGENANTATLIFRNAPDFESPQDATLLAGDDGMKNTYQMNIQASSTTSPNAERTMTQLITINVTDADDPPTFTTARDALMIMEGETALTVMLEVIDQDGDTLTLALTGGADQAQLRLTDATLSFISTPDFETPTDADANNIYEVEITASSISSTATATATGATVLSAVRTFNIAVADADDNAPELTSPTTFQIQSGETAVATLEATDADAGDTETIVFALTGGADQNQLTLTSAGVLSFTSPADFAEPTDTDADNIYAIEITLTSGSRPHMTEVALEVEVINIDRQSRQRIGNVILAHIARNLADNTQDVILARTSGRLTNNLELSNRQGDLDDLIKGIQGFSFMRRLDAKQADARHAADTDAGDAKERGFAFWVKGRIRTFSASPNETAINNFSGHTYNLNLGADYQTGALLFGGLITASQSNVKFTSGSAEGQGKIRTKLTTFAPFMHFRLQGGTEFWGSAGFGQGRMHYQSETTDGGFERTDLKYTQVAGGLYQPLKTLKKTNLALRVDGYTARLKADAFDDVFLAMAGDVSRVRALFEVGYRNQGVGNGVLDVKLNGGTRLERGDIGKGVGFEFGAEIAYANPASGLSVSADVNAILLHTAQKYRHLDAGLRFLLDPGIKKRGLQFRLEPRIGGSATPATPLWDGTLVDGSTSSDQQLGTSGLGQLQTALGLSYGFAARQSLLTPFTEMRLDDRGAPIDLMLGMRFSRANHPINITLYTQKVFRSSDIWAATTPGVHLKLIWK